MASSNEDQCEVYIDLVIKGLSTVYIEVRARSNITDNEVLIPETLFNFSIDEYLADPYSYPNQQGDHAMYYDAKISIVDG